MAQDRLASSMQELYVAPPLRDVRESGQCSRNETNLCSCCCCNNRAMEGESGSGPHLPDEVLSMILAFMPLMSILKCRLVAKRWNSLSQAALFRETYSRVSGDLPLQYLQALQQSGGFTGSQVVSSTGGLLLVTSFAHNTDQLFVVNPMTATVKLIPPMLALGSSNNNNNKSKHDFSVVGMVMDLGSNDYKILGAEEGARPVRLQVYESSHGTWQWAGTWSVRQPWRESSSDLLTYLHEECFNVTPISFHILEVALHDGALFCLSVSASRHFRVLRLDLNSDFEWVEIPGLFPPTSSNFVSDFRCRPVIFDNKGSLMIAGAQVTGLVSIQVMVWRYDRENAEWILVASAQEEVEEDGDACGASYLDTTFFYLDACGDHVCLGAFPTFRNPDPKVLIYNILRDSWFLDRLEDEESGNKLVYWQKRAFFYEPRSV